MRGRRGDAMVEAAMVLPVLILTVLSLILLGVFFFSCLQAQTQVHTQMLAQAMTEQRVFTIKQENTETSVTTRGIAAMVLRRRKESRLYEIRPAAWVRAGALPAAP